MCPQFGNFVSLCLSLDSVVRQHCPCSFSIFKLFYLLDLYPGKMFENYMHALRFHILLHYLCPLMSHLRTSSLSKLPVYFPLQAGDSAPHLALTHDWKDTVFSAFLFSLFWFQWPSLVCGSFYKSVSAWGKEEKWSWHGMRPSERQVWINKEEVYSGPAWEGRQDGD